MKFVSDFFKIIMFFPVRKLPFRTLVLNLGKPQIHTKSKMSKAKGNQLISRRKKNLVNMAVLANNTSWDAKDLF